MSITEELNEGLLADFPDSAVYPYAVASMRAQRRGETAVVVTEADHLLPPEEEADFIVHLGQLAGREGHVFSGEARAAVNRLTREALERGDIGRYGAPLCQAHLEMQGPTVLPVIKGVATVGYTAS